MIIGIKREDFTAKSIVDTIIEASDLSKEKKDIVYIALQHDTGDHTFKVVACVNISEDKLWVNSDLISLIFNSAVLNTILSSIGPKLKKYNAAVEALKKSGIEYTLEQLEEFKKQLLKEL